MEISVSITNINGIKTLSRYMSISGTFDFTRIAPIRHAIIEFLKETDNFLEGIKYTVEVKEKDNDYTVDFSPGLVTKTVHLTELLDNVMSKFNTSYDYMYENREIRAHYFIHPRNVFFTLARIFTRETLEEIGTYFEKNHATVLNSQISIYKSLRAKHEKLTSIIRQIGMEYDYPTLVYNILSERYFTF